MTSRVWLRIAAIMIPIGVLTTTVGARSIGSTVELAGGAVRLHIPESVELFAAGALLVAIAASAERVMRRRLGNA